MHMDSIQWDARAVRQIYDYGINDCVKNRLRKWMHFTKSMNSYEAINVVKDALECVFDVIKILGQSSWMRLRNDIIKIV